MLKKKMPNDAIKHCNEAISYDKSNPKAYYRLSQSYLALNDLDRAKENLTLAIEHAPNDTALRTEYKELCAIAEKHRVSASWVVRDAVDRYLTAEMPLLRQNSKRL